MSKSCRCETGPRSIEFHTSQDCVEPLHLKVV